MSSKVKKVCLFAFGLKSKKYIEKRDFTGLRAFKKDYPIAHCYLIYGGEHAEKHGDLTALPISQTLFKLHELLQSNLQQPD